ncbi:hypothetical protein [Streptosporangium amethystogenes]|uniref:hypothetical protein n=1 Tax=Streptosporangium amethystogenes TaxID=2002 RepID=UPI0004C6A071|nr:hypothetical protein [Streptosporangium amethystogenes]
MARQAATSERSGWGTPETSGSPFRTACRTAGTLLAGKAARPVAAKIIVLAQENMSEAGVSDSSVSCSGDM